LRWRRDRFSAVPLLRSEGTEWVREGKFPLGKLVTNRSPPGPGDLVPPQECPAGSACHKYPLDQRRSPITMLPSVLSRDENTAEPVTGDRRFRTGSVTSEFEILWMASG
jgi:hypothetical protein